MGWKVGRFFLLFNTAVCIIACFAVTVFCIGGILLGIHEHAVGVAQRPQYRADCAQKTGHFPTSPAPACYEVRTTMKLRVEPTRRYYNSVADVTLPNGKIVTEYLDQVEWNPKTLPPSGAYVAEVWHGTVTRIVVGGQSIPTYDNPLIMSQNDGLMSLLFGVAGIVTAVTGVGGVRAFKKARTDSSGQSGVPRLVTSHKRRRDN